MACPSVTVSVSLIAGQRYDSMSGKLYISFATDLECFVFPVTLLGMCVRGNTIGNTIGSVCMCLCKLECDPFTQL